MNIFIFIILSLFTSVGLASYEISESWDSNLRPVLNFKCSSKTNVCNHLCNDPQICSVRTSTCTNCISSGIRMSYLFNAFGKDISRSEDEVSIYELIDFIKKRQFITFSAKSIYNQFDSASSNAPEARFSTLCDNGFKSPVTFFESEGRELNVSKARFLFCGTRIYRLKVHSHLIDPGELSHE